MNCSLNVDISQSKALKALKDYFGANSGEFTKYVEAISKGVSANGNIIPSDRFIQWYKQHYKNELNFNSGEGKQLAERIRKYYQYLYPTVEGTYRNISTYQSVSIYGYTSPYARDFCKRIAANTAIDFYNQTEFILRNIPEKYAKVKEQIDKVGLKTFYFNRVQQRFNKILSERIAKQTGEDINTVQTRINNEGRKYVEDSLGGKNIPLQDANLVALVYEFQTSPKAFVEEICCDSRLGDLRFNKSEEFNDNNEPDNENEKNQDIEESTDEEDILNTPISMYDHTGQYKTAMMHVDGNIRAYLNSLKKLNSGEGLDNNKPDLDLNNPLGIADTMNADECSTVLYHYGNYESVDSMIESIKHIANNIPGFAAFHQLAKDLEANSDAAYQFYCTFGKTIIGKIETTLKGNITETRIHNNRSNKLEALGFEFMNSVKFTALDVDLSFALEEYNEYVEDLADSRTLILDDKPNNEFRKEAIYKLYKQLRRYYPTISEYAVENYINTNKNDDGIVSIAYNFGKLNKILKDTIESSEGTKSQYEQNQINKDYYKYYLTSNQEGAAKALAKALVDYSLVRVELNSRNIYGNQSSDVINNSYITNILKTLQNPISLENYGKYKFQSHQYDFSGIMLEHIDENGEVNKGLFRRNDDGTLVPTEYASELLKIRLFDGASNLDSDKNVSYANMSKGDYIGTAYINFFSSRNENTADYFMRIPSDAPRNFSIVAPKYSVAGLFKLANDSEITKAENNLRAQYAKKAIADYKMFETTVNQTPYNIIRVDQLVRHLFAEDGSISIALPPFTKGNQLLAEGKEVTLQYKYKNENAEDKQDLYIVKGTIHNGRLVNGSLVGFYSNDNNSFSTEVNDAIEAYIKKTVERSGIAKYSINKTHQIFRQFRNIFKQELLDAAIALDKFFVTSEDGLVQRYTENEAKIEGKKPEAIKWKKGISTDGREVHGAYENYHHKKGKIIEVKDGRETLVGNVFTSDRFIIFDKNNNIVRNYGQEILEEAFNFLYGGRDNTYLHTKKEDNVVTDVIITEEQQKVIDDKLEEFITNYINSSFNRLLAVENSLKGKELNYFNTAEFILNYRLMYVNFNDIFEGDTKFYKNAQDFLKRAKEVQGSGVPFGLVDYIEPLSTGKQIVERSLLNSTVFDKGYKVKQYNRFTGVTVVNTVMVNEEAINTLRKKLIKDCGLKDYEADRLLAGYKKGTTVNDAQSYITFDEWIRRISARGQLMKYKPLIDKIINEEELNAEEFSAFVQVQKNFYYDQNFDDGIIAPRQIKNAEFVLIPQLIKGTELEAVAAIMKKYDIDQLNTAETSKAGKADILEIFDSNTGKVRQDILDEINGGKKSEFGHRVGAASSLFNYNYLYVQQDTPQHVNSENKAGLQIVKKMFDNITEDSPLWDVKQKFFRLYCANIHDSFLNLMKDFNLETDENGNLLLEEDEDGNKVIKGLNVEVFCQRLKEECMRLGLDSNMLDYVTLDATRMADKGFNTIMPNYVSLVGQKLENIAQSIFNNRITRQKLPGFHASQITNIGFRALAESKTQVSYSKELKYHQDENGKYAPYVEIMLPASAFGFKRINDDGTYKPKGRIENNGKPTPGSLLEELQEAKLDEIIGYRIPTEGKQSVCRMKVVGFIEDGYGSTIVVPNDWVTQTGSDFDIDSVYGIQFETTVDPYGHIRKLEYSEVASRSYDKYVKSHMSEDELKEAEENKDFNYNNWAIDNDLLSREEWSEENKEKVAEDNSRASRNNEILQCMLNILGSNEALEENLSRSNFDKISHKADKENGDEGGAIQKNLSKEANLERDNRSAFDFLDQAEYQEDSMSGARLKGFSVTRDSFCSICNTVRPNISKQHIIKVAYPKDVISYKEAVARFGKENVEDRENDIVVTHDKFGWSNDNRTVEGYILTAYSSQTTAHILDAIKEGSVPNVNELTFAVYKLFPDVGSNYDTAVAFMMQNGVRRIVDAYNSTNSIYQESKGDYINKAIRDIAIELGMNPSGAFNMSGLINAMQKRFGADFAKIFEESAVITLDDDKIANIPINSQQLHDVLSTPYKGRKALLFDLGIILQYSKLSHLGNSITSLTRVCNPDKFGAKQSIYATNKVFDDVKELINGENPIPLEVKGNNFLEAIYPDVDKTLDEFIESPIQKSAYPSLYYFLKYATATSIKINRSLFITQSPEFIEAVTNIQKLLTNNGKLTEKQYKDIEKYIIGHLYNTCQSIMRPITYAAEGNIGFVPIAIENENSLDQDVIFEQERRRIFGYGINPNETVEIKNVSEPTQEEINAFAKLSPAQKVSFIQGNFSSAGVFKYIRPTLFNEKETGRRAGSQTIEFIDTTDNIEDIYQSFANAFSSNNPLVALTAYDVVKYAFAVEGYKLKKNGVSKMIPNSVLYNDFGINGTGVITELDGKIRNISATLKNDIRNIHEDYIRGHNMYQIPTTTVEKIRGGGFELPRRTGGIITFDKSQYGIDLAEKYNVVYRRGPKEMPIANNYVRLTFGKDTILYRIVDSIEQDGVIRELSSYYLYPLNNLEENEHGEFSSNYENNKHPNREYYKQIIEEYESSYNDFDADEFRKIAEKYDIKEFKSKDTKTFNPDFEAKDFSLEHPADNMIGAVDKLLSDVQKHFGDNNANSPLYILNGGLHHAISHIGSRYGLQGKVFTLNKNTSEERLIKLDIWALPYKNIRRLAEKYLGNNSDKQIKKGDEKYKNIITILRNNGISKVSEQYPTIFVVSPSNIGSEATTESSNIFSASLTETGSSFYKGMIHRSNSVSDAPVEKALQRLRDKGITTHATSVANNIDEVIRTTAEYVATATEQTINGLKYFAEDPNGDGYLSVVDPGVIDLIKHSPELIRKFLKTILDAEAIVTNFKSINELDIKSQNAELQRYLNKIKECVNDLQNTSLIRQAKELFANDYLAKLSDDPLIQQDILNILDGYHSTNSFTAWVNDLQETTSPFIQLISKNVIADIRAKEFEAVRRVRAWQSFVKGIKAKAAAAGKTINWDNIIDEDGRFIQDYVQELVDDMNNMRDAIASAKAQYGEGSIEHLEAQLKYNKWKLEHINQELDDEYYRKRIQLDEEMLHGKLVVDPYTGMPKENELSGGYPIVFSEYKKLNARRTDILSHVVNGVLDDYWKQQLEEVTRNINDLVNPYYHDPITGKLVLREEYDAFINPVTGTEEEKRKKILYSAASQRAISKYIKDLKELNTEYYGYDVEFGFEEELQRNLHIVKSYEKRDTNGNISVPMNILMENDEYVRAKEWIQANAMFVISAVNPELKAKLNEADVILRTHNTVSRLSTYVRAKNAYDEKGVINGTLLNDEEIANIKKDQETGFNIRESNPLSTNILINNASPTGEVYTSAFYKGMTSDGTSNPEWLAKVHEINELLSPYYDNGTKTIRFDLIPDTKEGIKLLEKLGHLYDELSEIKKKSNTTNGKEIAEFIEQNVDFNIDETEFAIQEQAAASKSKDYQNAWNAANYLIEDGERKKNHYIYGYITPKAEVKDKYLDKQKTEALQLINRTYTTAYTEYYYQKAQEMKQKGEEAYKKWYKENHIYNPYSHNYEPLRCWTTRVFRDTSDSVGKWEAKANKRTRRPNKEHINPNYKPEVGNALNYKKGTGYDNAKIKNANEFERELKLEMQKLLSELVKTKFGRRYIERGYMPSKAKDEETDAKFIGKELLRSIGWIEAHSGKEPFYEDLDYARDITNPMPMLSLLNQKRLESLNITRPVRESYDNEDDYNKAVEKYEEQVAKLKEENRKAHQAALNRNWEEVMEEFILKASHFNAVQDNKYMLFYGKSMLDNIGVYKRRYGFFGDYKKDYINSDDTTTEYIKQKDKNLASQYENWIRRIVYDQWKESNGMFTKWASRLQSITSAQYMMMNIRGGIANVTLGETNIVAEAFAKEYFGKKEWLAGKAYWTAGIPSYFANAYKPTSTSVADAIIKFFNVVDFDELTGKSRIVENPVSEGMRKFTNFMYSPQNIGENFMQNGAMFSMMMSHRLYEIEDPETHEKTIVFKNEHEAMHDAERQAVQELIKNTPLEEKFNDFVKSLKEDANKLKDYAWRRKDVYTKFVKQYLKEKEKEYVAKRKDLQNKAKEEFYDDAKHPKLIDQFALGDDQRLSFKKDSKLAEYDISTENGEPSKAYQLLANFRGRVISVNKKIHGVYDRLGQAQLEKLWYGSLVMQYHKHMYPGILKRWRREGSFNEERGTVEKGCYIALMDFLSIPFSEHSRKVKEAKDAAKKRAELGIVDLNDAQREAIEGVQNILKEIVDFATNITLNWNLLPQHERDNIRRCIGDLCGIMSALFMAVALRAMMDDDDEDSILFNLGLYEADRLASESFQFNPLGMYSEAKKLWSTSIAAQSGLQDLIQSAGLLSKMIIEGDEFDPYYHSGRFAGEHKLSVYVQRRIPIWRGIKTGFIDIVDSNSYYKMGDNMLGILPVNSWSETVKEKLK